MTRLPLIVPGSTAALSPDLSAEEIVVAYHERTKHHYHGYAASLGYMDWATQPNAFRRFAAAELVRLPIPALGNQLPYWQLYSGVDAEALSLTSLSQFFRYALSLTAWKRAGDARWALRANPSSGNLHPTESYALMPQIDGLHAGIYHYAPKEHGLEQRARIDAQLANSLLGAFPPSSFIVGLSSILWREAWKYGERAFRYCQHDVGHAIGSLRFAAAALGWKVLLFDESSDTIARLLGLDRDIDFGDAEREEPELLAVVSPSEITDGAPLPTAAIDQITASNFFGGANMLSAMHRVDWPVIDAVAQATHLVAARVRHDRSAPVLRAGFPTEAEIFSAPVRRGHFAAEKVILGRRSAVSMDATTSISSATFFQMLGRLIPTNDGRGIPWDTIPWRPRIHLGLFVHRVDGLPSGLYALVRDPEKLDSLKAAMHPEFLWERPAQSPLRLPLYFLRAGQCSALAKSVSCNQDIAADGAFSLGMIADYMESIVGEGASFYRNLFWEAGMVGQVLYLEAEEAGIRSTGIGCYFDDPVHQVFGLASRDWQSLYHFTVGGPVDDERLTVEPPYA